MVLKRNTLRVYGIKGLQRLGESNGKITYTYVPIPSSAKVTVSLEGGKGALYKYSTGDKTVDPCFIKLYNFKLAEAN